MNYKILLTSMISSVATFILICAIFLNTNTVSIGNSIDFQNRNAHFKFTVIPSKGRDYKMMERAFENFKKSTESNNDTILYRVTRKNYFNISKWYQYKNMVEWQYPLLR